MSSHNVLVLATGNDSCARTLLQRCENDEIASRWWVTFLDDTQLRVEHALSLTRADLCLFLLDGTAAEPGQTGNAGAAASDRGFSLRTITHGSGHQMTSSESDISPEDLLHTLATLGRHGQAPHCYALTLHSGATGLDEALAFLTDLLEHPEAEHWDRRLG
jgi:hypothetical protein